MENTKNTWSILSKIDCSAHVEKKNNLTYLSWAWAWGIVKENFPTANYKVTEYDGKPYLYDSALGYMVKTEVTIDGETIGMHLPVMDNRNNAMKAIPYSYEVNNPNFRYANLNKEDGKHYDKYMKEQTPTNTIKVEAATMFDINTAIMRCLTKNLAMFGLGHYIYAGEDLPKEIENVNEKETAIAMFLAKLKECKDGTEINELYKGFKYQKDVYDACVKRGKEVQNA